MLKVYIENEDGSIEVSRCDSDAYEFRDTYWQSLLIDADGHKMFSTLTQWMGEKDYMGFHMKLKERSKLGTFIQKLCKS